jgi:hypothetical protein
MLRITLYVIALVVGGVSLIFVKASTVPFVLITGIMIGIAIPLLDGIASNSRYLVFAWYSVRYRNQKIRISASYLFRIKLDNHYLLIEGNRWRQQYQPVGGVYKMSSGAREMMNRLGVLDDDLVAIDAASRNDLRIRVPASNLISFIRWFESGQSRETSSWREFYEELIKPGLLSAEKFPFILDNFVRREIRPLRFSSYAQSMELLVADIRELLPTADQEAALRSLKETEHPELRWVTADEIMRRGAKPGEAQEIVIAEPALWTL